MTALSPRHRANVPNVVWVGFAELRRGRLRVAALPSLCAFILPQVAKTFCARHGGVDLSIIDAMGDEVVEQVTRRQVDFGIGYVTSTDLVIAEPFLTDRLVAVGLPERLGGKRSLRDACQRAGVPVERALDLLEGVKEDSTTDAANWGGASAQELVRHIVGQHHSYVRSETPRLMTMFERS